MLSFLRQSRARLRNALPAQGALRGSLALGAALFLLASMLATSSLLSLRASNKREAAERWEAHTLNVLHSTAGLRLGALGMLRGEQAFLLTGDASFLQPYDIARAQTARDLGQLRNFVRDNPPQRAGLARIETHMQAHLDAVTTMITLERTSRHNEAIRRIRAGEIRDKIEAIMHAIDDFERAERALLATRTEAAHKASGDDAMFEYLQCIVGLGLVGLTTAAAVALRRSWLREAAFRAELQRIAVTDELTGLANRREILHALDWLIGAARRSGRPLSVAVLDIDHFKKVNDAHGHPAGDEVIRRVAQLAVEIMREQDLVGRLGGEEFVIAMPDIGVEAARLACERLREALSVLPILLPTGQAVSVTLSTGITQFAGDDDRTQLIARADEALYWAKKQGRNRVLLAA